LADRRNWPLIAGIALPALMLVGFIVYSYAARLTAEPPGYDAFFSVYASGPGEVWHQASLNYRVEDGRIVVQAHPLPQGGRWVQALYRLDHRTLQAERVPIPLPERIEEQGQRIVVESLADVPVAAGAEAPDGYRFRSGYDGGPGLIGQLFGPRQRGGITIEKVGVVHRVTETDGQELRNPAQFLGWVAP
jgi:hypothetical protein